MCSLFGECSEVKDLCGKNELELVGQEVGLLAIVVTKTTSPLGITTSNPAEFTVVRTEGTAFPVTHAFFLGGRLSKYI